MQRLLQIVFPHSCVGCHCPVEHEHGLCSDCWRQTVFIKGLVCDTCGVPLPGQADGVHAFCDDCLHIKRPWETGRAAMVYSGVGRRLVLALKHGDQQQLVRPAARWMTTAGACMMTPDKMLVPVPVHWKRLFKRRFNQAALLAQEVARHCDAKCSPQALVRPTATKTHDGMGFEDRFRNVAGAIEPHMRHGKTLIERDVVLVDDVMTSGATLAAATEACYAAGAGRVSILVLARVAKDA